MHEGDAEHTNPVQLRVCDWTNFNILEYNPM
jgi:hypothetical protein